MCGRTFGDLFTDLEFLMKFILFWVVALTTFPIDEKYVPFPESENVIELTDGLYSATVNGTLIMCVAMMIVLSFGEDVQSVANIMLPMYATLNFICGIVFASFASLKHRSDITLLVPIFFFVYFMILSIDIFLGYFYRKYKPTDY